MGLQASAAAPTEDCEAQVLRAPEDSESWRCFYLQARRDGDWEAVRSRLTAEVEQNPDNSHAWVNLAHASTATGGEDAVALYGRAIAGYTRTDDPSGLVPAHVALAIHLSHQGAGSEAVQAQLALARTVAEASGDPLLGAMVDSQEARVIWRQGGDMGRAYTLVRSAEQHAFPDGPYQLKLVVLHVLAGICEETRRLDEGHAASQRMVALTAESGDRYVEATARLNLAAFALNNPERTAPGTAERESMLAIEAAEAAGNPYVLAGALCTRADVLFQSGQPSLPWWRRCEAAYRALDEPGMSAMGTLGEAAVLADADGPAALALAHRVVAVGRDTGDEGLEVLGRLAVAGLTWAVEGPDAGRAAFVAHHAAAERLVDHQNDATSRAEVMSNWVDGHHMLAALLSQEGLGSIDLTIAEVERVRARELADALRSEAILSAGDPVAVEGLQELGKRLSALNIALAEATVDERPALARQREVLEYDEAVLRDSLQRSVHPTGLAAPTLAELQAELEDGEVLLSLQTPPVLSQLPTLQAAPWALAISRTQVGVAQLADRRTLDAAVQTFSGLHQDGGVSAATAERAAASLWAITVGPALAALGDDPLLGEGQLPRRIIVVPDGPLHDLPFAALRATPEGPPLGTTVDVSRTPSLTSWLALRRVLCGGEWPSPGAGRPDLAFGCGHAVAAFARCPARSGGGVGGAGRGALDRRGCPRSLVAHHCGPARGGSPRRPRPRGGRGRRPPRAHLERRWRPRRCLGGTGSAGAAPRGHGGGAVGVPGGQWAGHRRGWPGRLVPGVLAGGGAGGGGQLVAPSRRGRRGVLCSLRPGPRGGRARGHGAAVHPGGPVRGGCARGQLGGHGGHR